MIKPLALIGGAVVLVAVLYFFGDTVPPRPETAQVDLQENTSEGEDLSEVDPTDRIMASLKEEDIKLLNSLTTDGRDSSSLFEEYDFWSKRNIYLSAGNTAYELATLDKKSESWNLAGDAYMNAIATGEPTWVAASKEKAIEAYTNAKEAGDSSHNLQVKLALSYIDGRNEVMTGVQMLLAVVRAEPNHANANLVLGRLAVVSGQYEKALGRFNKLDSIGVQSAEMYLLMSEAHKGLGNMEKSIEALEACKKIIDDPELRSEIDKHIENIKNS